MGLDDVELVMSLEDFFGIKIPDEDAVEVFTVRELQDLCTRLIREQHGVELLEEDREVAIHEEVRVLIGEQMDIPLDRITPEARLARDLGLGR